LHCGKHILEGDVLHLVGCVMQVSDNKEPKAAIKLVKSIDGTEVCTVGLIPRAYATIEKIQKNGSYCFVLELYDISKNKYKVVCPNAITELPHVYLSTTSILTMTRQFLTWNENFITLVNE
jgi:hypothetical protein